MRVPRFGAALAALGVLVWPAPAVVDSQETAERFWPPWRGPHVTGVSRQRGSAARLERTRNIRWKVDLPGRGSSSPVVWGDRLFVVTAVPVAVTETPSTRRSGRSSREACTASSCLPSTAPTVRSSGNAPTPKKARGQVDARRYVGVELG